MNYGNYFYDQHIQAIATTVAEYEFQRLDPRIMYVFGQYVIDRAVLFIAFVLTSCITMLIM